MNVKNIPKDDRPRERLLIYGPDKLSNQELLAIILKTGSKEKNVMDLSIDLLNEFGGIDGFKNIIVSKLTNKKGIGEVKAITLVAILEFAKRIYFERPKVYQRLTTAKEIYENSKYLFIDKKQECFYCLYFNNKQELIERKLLFMGTFNRSVVHPREVFKEAYLTSASSIVCMHNHPSGDVKPSREDIIFTKSLIRLGEVNAIPILDHIIVGNNKYYSFYEENNIFNL